MKIKTKKRIVLTLLFLIPILFRLYICLSQFYCFYSGPDSKFSFIFYFFNHLGDGVSSAFYWYPLIGLSLIYLDLMIKDHFDKKE
ncbi:MAG: hypothetical protein E6249_07705 [Peptoniphilus grossensis]|uniref:hypothetical protein n=1 Tax=Peptoniphilus grossensis TaxID=1465756 RepID=UPI00290F3296|nr:hypothetical protein [Peptoniphilus grossensis]MDU5100342.1 hypothetical protein [Peptoniphilus grossensis]